MTDNLKTVDLNSLNSYTENLGNFVSDDLMPLPNPKDILNLNGELIDNYTGNGITKRGNVKIDENGIASGFSNRSNTILTSLNCMSLNDGFELQIKAKNNVNSQTIFCESTLNGDSNVCFCIALGNNDTDVGSYYNGYVHAVKFSFGTIPDKMHYFKYKYLNDTIYFKLLDEDMNVLFEQSASMHIQFRSRTFVFGRAMDNWYQSPYISVDLSETWFKDKDGNLISSWNK